MTRITRTAAMTVAACALALLVTAPAAAHVELVQAKPNGDGTTTITFGFDHGCDKAPTAELAISLPPGVTVTSTATGVVGWTATIEEKRVVWTGTPVPSGTAVHFDLVASIKAEVGKSLLFPAIQRCTGGATSAWIDQTGDAEHPAPRLVATAAILSTSPAAARPIAVPPQGGGGASLPEVLGALGVFTVLAAAAGVLWGRRRPAGPD